MSDIASAFRKCNLTIIRAQIEPINEEGAKHTYWVQCAKGSSKLTDYQIERTREELQAAVERHTRQAAGRTISLTSLGSPRVSPTLPTTGPTLASNSVPVVLPSLQQNKTDNDSRIRALEEKLAQEQELTRSVQQKLLEQGDRIEKFMARCAVTDLETGRPMVAAQGPSALSQLGDSDLVRRVAPKGEGCRSPAHRQTSGDRDI